MVKKYETRKTKFAIKNLEGGQYYAIKVRDVKGNRYGKWTTQFMRAYYDGGQLPGLSTASGKALEKEYEDWKKNVTKAELCQIYKRGFGTDVEIYQVLKDINKDMGISCMIIKDICRYPNDDKPFDMKRYLLLDLKIHKVLEVSTNLSCTRDDAIGDYLEWQ